jgi:glycosyltransferase involved in cell wall biosynthesis
MKIGIDARFLTHPQKGGFKSYTQNLIMALADIDRDNDYILYIDRPPNQDTQLPDRSNFTTCIIFGSLPMLGMPWREQIGLSRQAVRDKIDLLHSLCLTAPLRLSCPSVVTIHDMIWFFHSTNSYSKHKLIGWYYRFLPQLAIRNASAILTISQAAKNSIIQHLGLLSDQIFVTAAAASPIYRQLNDLEKIDTIRQKYNLAHNFILAIGSADPRKNITTLVEAYALLPESLQDQYPLVIVWTHKALAARLTEQTKMLGIDKHLHFLESVSDEDLVLLYNAASLFVFPSLYEGFGLPLLEAMACGTPVVAANNSSIPEIAGDAAILFEAKDREAIASTIVRVLTNPSLQNELIEKGLRQATNFSWKKCACETLAIYQKALLP